jgi:hypothetical protein
MSSENAAAIPSDEGVGLLGHVEITVGVASYIKLSRKKEVFCVPTAGLVPGI